MIDEKDPSDKVLAEDESIDRLFAALEIVTKLLREYGKALSSEIVIYLTQLDLHLATALINRMESISDYVIETTEGSIRGELKGLLVKYDRKTRSIHLRRVKNDEPTPKIKKNEYLFSIAEEE